ncbi:MAG: KpsF/GutQ family sugar-phosphate isomerase [Gammaproteobacteria bacterium WSBS_2016_MAG_OTU1]
MPVKSKSSAKPTSSVKSKATKNANTKKWLRAGREVFNIECEALETTRDKLDESFAQAVQMMLACKGKVACLGVGKSGHIAHKTAATLASTGTPAFYLHPTEAGHGDVGALSAGDIALAMSHSGDSSEVLELLPALRRMKIKLISISGVANSSLAQAADVSLVVHVEREACPLNLAPTASSTAMLALADALAITLLQARDFSPASFAMSHPAGMLGRRLLTQVADVMRVGEELPMVSSRASFAEALVEMTGKRMGMVLVADRRRLQGIFTDGDLRRAVSSRHDVSKLRIAELMTASPRVIAPDLLATEALKIMREKKIGHLAVIEKQKLIGALSIHDLLAYRL